MPSVPWSPGASPLILPVVSRPVLKLQRCTLCPCSTQFTGYDPTTGRITSKPGPGVVHISGTPFLDNNMVNALSASLTAGLTALATLKVFGM